VAAVITLLGIGLNFAILGAATLFLSAGLIAAYVFWRFGSWQPDGGRVLRPYFLCLVFFGAHFVEEYFTGFYRDFPALFGSEWSPQRFLTFNFAWLVAFAASALGVYYRKSAAYLVVIFFAFARGISNGATHIVLSLIQGRPAG
jgi:hypothetical protein